MKEGATVVGCMPIFLKEHSYGEYIFDWAWAEAFQRHGLNYYPKLVCAIPFSPVTGPRILAKNKELKDVNSSRTSSRGRRLFKTALIRSKETIRVLCDGTAIAVHAGKSLPTQCLNDLILKLKSDIINHIGITENTDWLTSTINDSAKRLYWTIQLYDKNNHIKIF